MVEKKKISRYLVLLLLLKHRPNVFVDLLGISVSLFQRSAVKQYNNNFPAHYPIGRAQTWASPRSDPSFDSNTVPELK